MALLLVFPNATYIVIFTYVLHTVRVLTIRSPTFVTFPLKYTYLYEHKTRFKYWKKIYEEVRKIIIIKLSYITIN